MLLFVLIFAGLVQYIIIDPITNLWFKRHKKNCDRPMWPDLLTVNFIMFFSVSDISVFL